PPSSRACPPAPSPGPRGSPKGQGANSPGSAWLVPGSASEGSRRPGVGLGHGAPPGGAGGLPGAGLRPLRAKGRYGSAATQPSGRCGTGEPPRALVGWREASPLLACPRCGGSGGVAQVAGSRPSSAGGPRQRPALLLPPQVGPVDGMWPGGGAVAGEGAGWVAGAPTGSGHQGPGSEAYRSTQG